MAQAAEPVTTVQPGDVILARICGLAAVMIRLGKIPAGLSAR
jgi:hypothetical protein